MLISIIKYNAGNTQSVVYALNRLGIQPEVTDDPEILMKSDKVIFPGVGEASTAMNYLKARNLDKLIPQFKQPFLGICLGLQLMCKHTEEGNVNCLNVFPMKVLKFPPKDKVPHMGWNSVSHLKGGIFEGVSENDYVYFVHSFYAELSEYTIAQTDYIVPFSSAINKDNFYAVQFHAEKSGVTGEKILDNFLKI